MRDIKDIELKNKIFVSLAEKFNGNCQKKYNSSEEITRYEITILYKNLTILVQESDTKPLKIEIEIPKKLCFEFILGLEDFVSKISKKFGKKEVITDYDIFDQTYLIESTDFQLCKKFLSRELMAAILKNNLYSVSLQHEIDEEKTKLILVKSRTEDNLESYIDFVEVAMMTVDNLQIV